MYNTSRNHLPPNGSEPKSTDETLPIILAGPIVRRCEFDSSNKTATVNIWLATSKNFESICAGTLNISTIGELICAAPEISSTFDVVKVSDNFWVWMLKIKFDTNVDSLNEVISQNNRDKTLSEIETRRNNNKVKHIIGGDIFEVDITPPAAVSTSVVSPLSEIQQHHISVTPLASKAIYAYDINFLSKKVVNDDCDSTCIEEKYESQTLTEIMGVDMGDETEGIKAITLSHLALPIFSVQTEEQSLKCLFGSCRKPHGIGEDASIGMELKLINSILKFRVIDGDKEFPNAQFLTGDQIYADDVHVDLLKYLIKPLVKKLNIKETLVSATLYDGSKRPELSKIPNDRKTYTFLSGFTSTESKSHLLYFGEFAAMYLIMWNSKLWDQSSRTKTILKDALEGTKSIRRVLANVPTYMIIDDHDVTDDFYFDDDWKTDVLSMTSGRRVISHALSNYWLFQAWGNTFEGIPENFSEMIEGYTQGNESEKYDYDKTFTEYQKWSFIAPTDPPAIFLNTRTQRKSEKEAEEEYRETISGPILINNDEYTRMIGLVKKHIYFDKPNKPVIFVSPSPMLTLTSVEKAILAVKSSSPLEGDIETFNSNRHTFYQFIYFIHDYIKPSHLIVVSGDVHYSTIGYGRIAVNESSIDGYNSNVHPDEFYVSQFTSSALKNSPTGGANTGLILLDDQVGKRHSTTYYYKRVNLRGHHGDQIISWARWDLMNFTPVAYGFYLKYDFVNTNESFDTLNDSLNYFNPVIHNRAYSGSNFGFLEKSSSKTTITASIRNSNNEECIGFEGDTKKWPI